MLRTWNCRMIHTSGLHPIVSIYFRMVTYTNTESTNLPVHVLFVRTYDNYMFECTVLAYASLFYRMLIHQQMRGDNMYFWFTVCSYASRCLMNMLAYGSIHKNRMYQSPNMFWLYVHTIISMSSYGEPYDCVRSLKGIRFYRMLFTSSPGTPPYGRKAYDKTGVIIR